MGFHGIHTSELMRKKIIGWFKIIDFGQFSYIVFINYEMKLVNSLYTMIYENWLRPFVVI